MIPRLHLVTDDDVLARPDVVDQSVRLIASLSDGVALHIRGPGTAGYRVFEVASRIHEAVGGDSLVINDRVDVAMALDGSAVHLRSTSLPPEIARRILGPGRTIGLSLRADSPGPVDFRSLDYLIAGSAFPTASHPGGKVAGVDAIGRVADSSPVPVVAIGGISTAHIGVLVSSGAYGVAVIRAVWSDPDPVRAATVLLNAINQAVQP